MPAAGVSCLFPTMEDSPMFRSKVSELTSHLDPILDRSAALVGGAKDYRDGLGNLVDGTNSWVDSLERFCEGTDEEALSLGGGLASRFLAAFKELASFNELLRTQVDVLLCERMQDEWSKLTSDVKEAKRKMDKRVAEAEHMKLKHLGHSKARGWRPEIEQAELLAAQGAADEQRFMVARKVTEVETRKRYEFLEAILSAVDAHLQYFRRGQQVFACLEEYLQQALAVVEVKRQEEKAHVGALEDAIDAYRVARSLREAALAEAVQSTQQRAQSREAGPLQLKPGAMKEVVESHMHTTSDSGGAVVTVLHSGYLLKKSSNLRKEWNRRFFVLDSQGMLYYYSNKERRDGKSLQNSVHLLTCTIKPDDEDASLRYCFRVVSPDKTYTLQAEDELDKQEWIEALQSVISVLLNSNDLHQYASGNITQQRTPSRPTHTRTPSGTISLEEYDRALDGTKSPFGASATNSPMGARPSTSGREEHPTTTSTRPGSAPEQQEPHKMSALRPRSPSAPLAALRGVPGNRECAECGAPDPDWASLNLGVLLCIECSGVHRNLGVHVSKVRSLTLDVAVWQPHVLQMFSMLGNAEANGLWEGNLGAAVNQGDAWVWCEDSDSDDDGLPRREVHVSAKPRPHDRLAAKEAFITAKYVQRKFVVATSQSRGLLWRGGITGDVRAAYAGLVGGGGGGGGGGGVGGGGGGGGGGGVYASPAAVELARRVQGKMVQRMGGRVDGLQVCATAPGVTALHAAAMNGHLPTIELLCLAGAPIDARDCLGRTPLQYAALYDQHPAVELLRGRGASVDHADATGVVVQELIQA